MLVKALCLGGIKKVFKQENLRAAYLIFWMSHSEHWCGLDTSSGNHYRARVSLRAYQQKLPFFGGIFYFHPTASLSNNEKRRWFCQRLFNKNEIRG
ncbi:hypothetical protein PsW64_00168 [Pseudovibrio sp. W64]|nr:hypothetical protein PsW64_00168 [Pseudovibrio sp. W64]KZK94038.1 hypothetical protein PsW74_04697 [Pseudovibrio sp. W74]KZL10105.1 hypothetical protein PsAD14_01630 [Pseudovibrio sp. Ad14]